MTELIYKYQNTIIISMVTNLEINNDH